MSTKRNVNISEMMKMGEIRYPVFLTERQMYIVSTALSGSSGDRDTQEVVLDVLNRLERERRKRKPPMVSISWGYCPHCYNPIIIQKIGRMTRTYCDVCRDLNFVGEHDEVDERNKK